MSLNQYLKDTRVELKHVAWPTQTQTIIYTILVVGVSVLVALYIGFFDFLFTRGLDEILVRMGSAPSGLEVAPVPKSEETKPIDFDVLPSRAIDENGNTITPPAPDSEKTK